MQCVQSTYGIDVNIEFFFVDVTGTSRLNQAARIVRALADGEQARQGVYCTFYRT